MKTQQTTARFTVKVEEGSPHGDLYELEQDVFYSIVDTHSNRVVMTFQGLLEASLSKDTGEWADYHISSGVSEVTIAPDELAVIVKYADGREEMMPLPI